MTISLSQKKTWISVFAILGAAIGIIAVSCSKTYAIVYLLDVVWTLSIVVFVGIDINNMHASSIIKMIVVLGLLARILVMILGTIGPIPYRNLFNESDQGGFIRIAYDYFCGDFSTSSTRYPYLINLLYRVFGPFELVARFLNIVFWYMGFRLLYVASGKKLYGKDRVLVAAFYCLLPMQIKITAGAMRESIMAYSIMVSLFLLYKWMSNGRMRYIFLSVIATLPAVLLHTGCAAMLGTIFFAFVFWDKRIKKWNVVSWKAGLFIIAIVCIMPIYNLFCALFADFNYLPKELTIESITSYPYWPGRSDYIIGDGTAHTAVEFVQGTLYRCFYFWVSPTPKFWNSSLDLIGFFCDSIPWIVLFFFFIKRMRTSGGKIFGKVGFLLIVLYTFVYAWGTRNAGTAMRHRDVLTSALALTMMMEINYEGTNKSIGNCL